MMKSTYISIIASVLILLIYQNCSPSHSSNESTAQSFSVESVYPYFNQKPTYFDNVQLTKAYEEDSIWKYQYVASIVYIDDPQQYIDIEIKIYDENNNLLCPRTSKTISTDDNHILIDNCESDKQVKSTKIEVYAKLASTSGELQLVSTYLFKMVYQ
ncbi:MAG: hypothetical protein H6623_08100 [Bdellovibrionaceae bacterium]|nr:hypothetical protein [Pseudobdellovibrionaceae bacterium]